MMWLLYTNFFVVLVIESLFFSFLTSYLLDPAFSLKTVSKILCWHRWVHLFSLMLRLPAPANHWPQPQEQQWFHYMNRPYYFAPKYFNNELRNTCIISVTVAQGFCSCWTGCCGVTQNGLPKGASRQGETGTSVWGSPPRAARYRPGTGASQPQPGWWWNTKKKQTWNERAEFPHSPSKCRQAAVAPGERVAARILTDSASGWVEAH